MNILITGSYGTGNVGDEVILAQIISLLKEDNNLTILSQGPEYTRKYFKGVKVCQQTPSWRWQRILKDLLKFNFSKIKERIDFLIELYKCNIFWVGGGGLFAEIVPTVLEYYIHQMKLAKILRKKVYVLGVGVGPLKTSYGKVNLRNSFNRIPELIFVRDEISKKLLLDIGVIKNVKVVPDFAFYFQNTESIDFKKKKKIIFNFYPIFNNPHVWSHSSHRFENLKRMIIDVTLSLIESNYQVEYLPFGTEIDRVFAREMAHEVNHPECSVYEGKGYRQIIERFNQCSLSITMRFHAGLMSFLTDTPSICIDTQFKSERLLKDMQLDQLLLSLPDGLHKNGNHDISKQEVMEKIDFVIKSEKEIRSKINGYIFKKKRALKDELSNISFIKMRSE